MSDESKKGTPQAGDTKQDGRNDAKGGDKLSPAKKRRRFIIAGVVVLILAAIGGTYLFATRNETTTDDAYTDGRAVTVAAQVTGYVTVLAVNDNQFVHRGDLLVQIDQRPYIAAVDQAKANLLIAEAQSAAAKLGMEIARKNFPAQLDAAKGVAEQAKGQLFNAESEFKRQHHVASAATTQQAVDQSTAQLQQAQGRLLQAEAQVTEATPVQQNIGQTDQKAHQLDAQVLQAKANLEQAELNLGYTRIVAPQDGWVTRRNVEAGNYLQAGGQIMALVTPDIWITANFKETQLDRMRPGQHCDIEIDAYPGLHLRGHVNSVQLGSGSRFTAFPAENATGNFVKIVQRVPVKIVIDSGLDPHMPLGLGLSVEPTVYLQ
jgi:membrane fusion protein (multidrug efflux system)